MKNERQMFLAAMAISALAGFVGPEIRRRASSASLELVVVEDRVEVTWPDRDEPLVVEMETVLQLVEFAEQILGMHDQLNPYELTVAPVVGRMLN